MAEGLGSLASSFLAGFQTMDGYQRGKKQDERADKALGLREAESQRQADYQQWSMKRTEGRDAKADEQWGLGHALQREQFEHGKQASKDASVRGWAQLSLAQRQQKLNEQRQQRQQQMEEDQLFLQQNGHVIQAAYNNPELLLQNPDLLRVFEHRAAKHLDPRRFADPELAQANRTVMGHLHEVVQMGARGELDNKSEQELHQLYNKPEVIKAANKALEFELGKGVGDLDPDTGKAIKAKRLAGFVPGPSGDTLIPTMEVEYDDGSTARRPATLNRSADPDDPVREIPATDLIRYFGSQGAVIQQMQQSGVMGQLSQTMGFSQGPDSEGYKKAATQLEQQYQKDVASLERSSAFGTDAEGKEAAREQLERQRQRGLSELRSLYGVGGQRESKPGNPVVNLSAWVEGDPGRQQFLQALAQRGELKNLTNNPAAVDEIYNEMLAVQEEQQQNAVYAGIEEKIMEKAAPSLREAGPAQSGPYNARFPADVDPAAVAAGYRRANGQ